MPGKDDLVDAFDDDNLRRSIEAAEGKGPWRDDDATFVDPKLQALAEQLAHAPRQTYTERRLAELDRRAAKKAVPVAPPPASPFVESPPLPEPIVAPAPVAIVPAAPTGAAWLRTVAADGVPTMLAAWLVFALAMTVQGVVTGFTTELYLRSAVVSTLVGIAWCCCGAGRFRCAAIGAGAHLVGFLASTTLDSPTDTFGVFLAMLLVLLGSGAVGLSRESTASDRT